MIIELSYERSFKALLTDKYIAEKQRKVNITILLSVRRGGVEKENHISFERVR